MIKIATLSLLSKSCEKKMAKDRFLKSTKAAWVFKSTSTFDLSLSEDFIGGTLMDQLCRVYANSLTLQL